jgi:glutathione S-transferase
MADVKIYGFPQSTYVRTARMACEEKGVAYDLEPIELGSAAHLALQPFGKMPGFRHGDVTLYETAAICFYIDATFDGPALQPSDTATMARMIQWISATNDYGYQAIIRELVIPRVVLPMRGLTPDEAAIKAALPKIERFLEVADATLKKSDYLAGKALTIADLMLVPCVFYLSMMPEGKPMLPKYKGVSAWFKRMSERPSFAATMPPPPPKQEAAE